MVIIAVGMSNPFDRKKNLVIEFMNESLIMISSYHLFTFTDFVSSPQTRYLMGRSIIFFTCTCIIVNLSIVTGEAMIGLCRKGKIRWLRLKYLIANKSKKESKIEKKVDEEAEAEKPK